MPEGSSSAAPVTRPGPSIPIRCRSVEWCRRAWLVSAAVAGGHPLTLIELGRELKEGRDIPEAPPGLPMRAGERLEWLYLDRLRKLPATARTLLLVAAAEHLGDPETVWRAAGVLGLDAEVAVLPEVRQMLSLSPRVAFSHPLMRTAAYWGAPPGERRRVHAALAKVTDPGMDPDRRSMTSLRWRRQPVHPGPLACRRAAGRPCLATHQLPADLGALGPAWTQAPLG